MTLDASKSNADAALMALYERLCQRSAPQEGSFTALTAPERREYFRVARRRSRERERAAARRGDPEPTMANVRAALADAALMILATGGPGADQVRMVLGAVFHRRPGVPLTVERKARLGRLRPKVMRP